MVADEDLRTAVEAARLAVASDDYDELERAGLELLSLARRAKQEGRGRPSETDA